MQCFSRLVRTLMLPFRDFKKPYTVSYNSLRIVRDHYPGTSLLPKLQHLFIEDWNISPFYGIFLSPLLESLVFFPDDVNMTLELFKALDTQTCNLIELSVGSRCGYGVELPSIADTISRFILRQTRLRCVVVPTHITAPAMKHLALTPSLRYLKFDFLDGLYDAVLAKSSANFSGLKSLCLRGAWYNTNVTALTAFLDTLSHPSPLRNLDVDFTAYSSNASLPEFFAVLSRFTGLTRFTLEFKTSSRRWDGPPVPAGLLEPLHRIRAMYHLDLSKLPMEVTPDDIRKMAAAWPYISTIELGQEHYRFMATIALEDTSPFTEHCPHLCSLGVKLLPEAKIGWVAPTPRHLHPSILVNIGYSWLHTQDATHIAAIFAQLFPAGRLIVGVAVVEAETTWAVKQINNLKIEILRAM